MQDFGFRKMFPQYGIEFVPRQLVPLASPAQSREPDAGHLGAKRVHTLIVSRHGVVVQVSLNYPLYPLPLEGDRFVPTPEKRLPDVLEFGTQPLGHRFPKDHVFPLLAFTAHVRKPQEVEGLWLSFGPLPTPLGGEATKQYQASFLRMQFQAERSHSHTQLIQKCFGIQPRLKSQNEVITVATDYHFNGSLRPSPLPNP